MFKVKSKSTGSYFGTFKALDDANEAADEANKCAKNGNDDWEPSEASLSKAAGNDAAAINHAADLVAAAAAACRKASEACLKISKRNGFSDEAAAAADFYRDDLRAAIQATGDRLRRTAKSMKGMDDDDDEIEMKLDPQTMVVGMKVKVTGGRHAGKSGEVTRIGNNSIWVDTGTGTSDGLINVHPDWLEKA